MAASRSVGVQESTAATSSLCNQGEPINNRMQINNLPYRCLEIVDGAGSENRTRDIRITSAVLYQLSYPGAILLYRNPKAA